MPNSFFPDPGYMPHIHCYLGDPTLVWSMVITDLAIGFAYVAISLTLWSLIRKIQIPFSLVIVCFGLFIGACGATHFMEVWTLWHPDYRVAAVVKAITAIASVGTGIYLFRLRHLIVWVAESAKLADQRKAELEKLAGELELRVKERTRDIEALGSRLMRISSATDLGIWYCDLPFNVLNWSRKTKEHFWMSENEVVTIDTFYDHIHPQDVVRTREAIAQSILSRKAYDIEYRTIHPLNPQAYKWIRAIGWTDYNASGDPVSFDGITLDLTEKKKKEDENKLLQADFFDLLERTTDGFFIMDGDWQISYANPITQKFFAVDSQKLIGQPIQDIFRAPDGQKFMSRYQQIISTGIPDRFEETYESHVLQVHAYKTREGGVAVFYRDVTEQVQARDQLKQSEVRYETLTSAIPQLVWTCMPDGKCNYLSQQWENYTGVAANQQMDLNWLERVIHPEDRQRTLTHWMGAVGERHPYDIEYRIKRFDGVYRWFQTRGIPMRDDNHKITYWVGTCTDIQGQKILAEELNSAKLIAERASEAKTQFLANMSHEIRTPIGAIIGFAEMLNNPEQTDTDKQNFSKIIERNSKHLLRLIDDILDLSKVEAGKIAFEEADFSLVEFLTDIEAVMSLKASEKGIQFSLRVSKTIPSQVYGDQMRLKQILANVVGNAIKFTAKGSVTVEVKYEHTLLTLAVSDTGVGIAPESIENLFKPFTQADPSLTRKFGGTGLGLILSKRLANQFKGDLWLERTKQGEGSRFLVTVHLRSSEGARFINFRRTMFDGNLSTRSNSVAVLQGLRILLVEDSPDNQFLISTYLHGAGAEVLSAEDGLEGFARGTQLSPDIILMDIQMPRMNGYDATRKLRASGFDRPIIALTAHAMRDEKDRCLAAGCSDYLTKPLRRATLLEAILRAIKLCPE